MFKALHSIQSDFESIKDYELYHLVYNSIILLNFMLNIKD